MFSHMYKAERANWKRGEVTNFAHSDFCPSARWHPSHVTSWKADVQIPEPMEGIFKSNHYTLKSKENKGKKNFAEESGEG